MRGALAACLLLLAMLAPAVAGPADTATETIVLLRHGEKPAAGLGQLTCQGLNRALRLQPVLQRLFGRPDAMFAPDPAVQKEDGGTPYDYVRPLATIEPAAIGFGLPVQAGIGVARIDLLQHALAAPQYRGALVVVAWEHREIVALARALLGANGGDPSQVPRWPGRDFDSLYVVRITRGAGAAQASFTRMRQGLDGQATACPGSP